MSENGAGGRERLLRVEGGGIVRSRGNRRPNDLLGCEVGARLRRVRRPELRWIARQARSVSHTAYGRHAVAPLPDTGVRVSAAGLRLPAADGWNADPRMADALMAVTRHLEVVTLSLSTRHLPPGAATRHPSPECIAFASFLLPSLRASCSCVLPLAFPFPAPIPHLLPSNHTCPPYFPPSKSVPCRYRTAS